MKKISIILFLLTSIFFISCEKDYPDDIPYWLEQKIQDYKINNDGCTHECPYLNIYGTCITIEEWIKDNVKIYKLKACAYYAFYDIDGNRVCISIEDEDCKPPWGSNDYLDVTQFQFNREIWKAK